MTATDTAANSDISLTVLTIVNDQDRSRDLYHTVLGAEIVRDRDPVILRFHNGLIVLNVLGERPARRRALREDGVHGGRPAS